MEKMDPVIKEQWLAALRSGRYVQQKGRLCKEGYNDGKYHMCCLGVLEHICGTSVEEMSDNAGIYFPTDLGTPHSPKQFWYDDDAKNKENDLAHILSTMNDGLPVKGIEKHSFEEIADYIEKNL